MQKLLAIVLALVTFTTSTTACQMGDRGVRTDQPQGETLLIAFNSDCTKAQFLYFSGRTQSLRRSHSSPVILKNGMLELTKKSYTKKFRVSDNPQKIVVIRGTRKQTIMRVDTLSGFLSDMDSWSKSKGKVSKIFSSLQNS